MITVRDLSWQYEPLVDGGKPVDSLKHVSFDIKSGSVIFPRIRAAIALIPWIRPRMRLVRECR